MTTDMVYPCLPYTIFVESKIQDRRIDVDVLGIRPPRGICFDAIAPATCDELLPLSEGDYTLTVSFGGLHDAYAIAVTEALRISATDAGFTRPETELAWRFPVRSFAVVCEPGEGPAAIRAGFIDGLAFRVDLREYYAVDTLCGDTGTGGLWTSNWMNVAHASWTACP